MNGDLLAALNNLVNDMGAPALELLNMVCYIVGFAVFAVSVTLPLKGKGQMGATARGIISGTALLSFPVICDALSETLFQSSASTGVGSSGGSSPIASAVTFSIWAMRISGAIAIARGIYLFKTNSQSGHGSGATVYCAAGVLLLNCVTAARALAASAGGIVQDVINKLLQ